MKVTKVRIKKGWLGCGREGTRLGPDVTVGQLWTPVIWDDEEDPTFHKSAGVQDFECEVFGLDLVEEKG